MAGAMAGAMPELWPVLCPSYGRCYARAMAGAIFPSCFSPLPPFIGLGITMCRLLVKDVDVVEVRLNHR
jgi:hypothetical protein